MAWRGFTHAREDFILPFEQMFNIHRNGQSALVLSELGPGSEQLQIDTHSLAHEALCDVNVCLFSRRSPSTQVVSLMPKYL